MVGGSCKEIEQLQFFGRHIYLSAHIEYGIVGQIDDKIRIFHTFHIRGFRLCGCRLISSQHSLYPCDKLLGIKGLLHIIVSAQLQAEDLVKDLALCREHNDR